VSIQKKSKNSKKTLTVEIKSYINLVRNNFLDKKVKKITFCNKRGVYIEFWIEGRIQNIGKDDQ